MELSGKECLVTGGNSGLGLVVSKSLEVNGARVTLLCRNREKGDNAMQKITGEVPDASINLMICDFA